ncbi:efflux RND transporter periplasmic adaptor subunit [Rhizosphaericola mali]|uniref:Efflux RND transporter periplasmic adaptor subunit n=1 Tax=Rhizosphaericola mali TaxID=2545455 RepID=A0A5P2G9P2_9BACT|nr:efflux RND transporter periplasmic adaptor subunit [Rhizosphaericola mali]QES88231.1 efflux RND transporter periplasmic adaptor subunit [Rhizosphaericola mali]
MIYLNYKKLTQIALAGGIVCASFFLESCGNNEATKEEKKQIKADTATQSAPEEVFLIQKGTVSTDLQIPGELIAYQHTEIYAKVNSYVQNVLVDVGSVVSRGQLLAKMIAPEISSQLAGSYSRWQSQEATYLASKTFYNRLLETSKTPGTVASNDLEQALARRNSDYAQLLSAKANYSEIQVNQSYLTIRAPFDGIITARNINPGAYVGPSGSGDQIPMLVLQQQGHMRLVISVPQQYTNLLKMGDALNFTTTSLPGQIFSGKIARISGALDPKLRSERVEMDVYNKGSERSLIPGMTVEVNMPLSSGNSNAYVVPRSAVVNSDTGIRVVKVSNGKYVAIPVSIGTSDDKKMQVFGNLNPKDTLVLNASEQQRDGQPSGPVILSSDL